MGRLGRVGIAPRTQGEFVQPQGRFGAIAGPLRLPVHEHSHSTRARLARHRKTVPAAESETRREHQVYRAAETRAFRVEEGELRRREWSQVQVQPGGEIVAPRLIERENGSKIPGVRPRRRQDKDRRVGARDRWF